MCIGIGDTCILVEFEISFSSITADISIFNVDISVYNADIFFFNMKWK